MHPISVVLAIADGKTVCKYAGFNAHDAEKVFTDARADAKNTGLALVQNAYPRLTCSPADEAANAKSEDELRRRRAESDEKAKTNAAKQRVDELKAALAEAQKALQKA